MPAFLTEKNSLLRSLDGKVAITPVTVELDPGVWVTRFPHIEVHGSSPEESRLSFDERLEEVERNA